MAQTANAKKSSGRELALARRRAMSSGGKVGVQAVQASPSQAVTMTAASARRAVGTAASSPSGSGRSASMARRKAMSSRGKVGVASTDRTRTGVQRRRPLPRHRLRSPQPGATADADARVPALTRRVSHRLQLQSRHAMGAAPARLRVEPRSL
jgi:hypothetical protein